MSNRRKPKAEKVAAVRCPRCRCRDFRTKVFQDGARVHVCQRCETIFNPTPSDREEQR